ncbi:hypothetical protein RMATCC62417_02413 [Rhizopus microsporus]|nr:hypothetical protein RMATCC62417_02413 [Rhizopus microsporus]
MKRHIFNIHGKDITISRSKKVHGKSAHGIPTLVYNTNNVKKCKENTTIIIKFSCPGCRDTFDTVSGFVHHVDNSHIKILPSLKNLLPKEKRWFLDGQDVSSKFRDYHQLCNLASRTTEFAIESHFTELLAMPGILVFQQRRDDYDDLPTDLFSSTLLTTTRKETLAKYRRDTFQSHVRLALQSII